MRDRAYTTVADLVAALLTLDQDKHIWIGHEDTGCPDNRGGASIRDIARKDECLPNGVKIGSHYYTIETDAPLTTKEPYSIHTDPDAWGDREPDYD